MIGAIGVAAAFAAVFALCRGAITGYGEWFVIAAVLWLIGLGVLISHIAGSAA